MCGHRRKYSLEGMTVCMQFAQDMVPGPCLLHLLEGPSTLHMLLHYSLLCSIASHSFDRPEDSPTPSHLPLTLFAITLPQVVLHDYYILVPEGVRALEEREAALEQVFAVQDELALKQQLYDASQVSGGDADGQTIGLHVCHAA